MRGRGDDKPSGEVLLLLPRFRDGQAFNRRGLLKCGLFKPLPSLSPSKPRPPYSHTHTSASHTIYTHKLCIHTPLGSTHLHWPWSPHAQPPLCEPPASLPPPRPPPCCAPPAACPRLPQAAARPRKERRGCACVWWAWLVRAWGMAQPAACGMGEGGGTVRRWGKGRVRQRQTHHSAACQEAGRGRCSANLQSIPGSGRACKQAGLQVFHMACTR